MKTDKKTIKLTYNIIIFAIIIAGCWAVISRYAHINSGTFTDNAQIHKNIVPVNVRVHGYISEIRFEDFSKVRKGDTLVLICDSEHRLRVSQAEAGLASARLTKEVTLTGLSSAENNISVADAAIEESRFEMENALKEYERYEKLYEDNAVTKQQYDDIKTRYDVSRTRHDRNVLQKKSALLAADELKERLMQTESQIRLAEAALELARLNLSYTAVTASCDGITGKKQINIGQLVQPGQTLLTMIDGDETWVIANYRERQMKHIRPGSKVSIKVDAVPGTEYKGVVESISDATGASYSIFPQNNATGNFVKTEQRIPVKIRLTEDNGKEMMSLLRAGMNVECFVSDGK